MAILLSLSLFPIHASNTKPPNLNLIASRTTKRHLILKTISFSIISLASVQHPFAQSIALAEHSSSPTSKPGALSGIANTKSWFQFYGDGFSIRVPPQFEDISEPEVHLLYQISNLLW